MPNDTSPPGWYQDPTGQGEARYWNGSSWTQMTHRAGRTVDVPIDPSMAQLPPVPGTQMQPPAPARYDEPSSGGSSGGAIVAIVIGLLLLVAVLVAIDDDSVDDAPTPGDGSVPTEEAPADDQPPPTNG